MPHLVSLISDQPIPNLLFIQSVEQEVGGYIFISTQQMESKRRTYWLKKAADLPEERCRTIEVEAEKYYDTLQLLANEFSGNEHYIVNLTGGNKLMMLACYHFFMQNSTNELFYLPIGEKTFQNLRSKDGRIVPVTSELTVWEYLTAYGIGFDAAESTLFDLSKAHSIMQLHRDKGFRRIDVLHELKLQPDWSDELFYYDGGWFEEYIFYTIKNTFQLSEAHIYLNVTFHPGEGIERNVNELDIVFVYNNELFIIEAKAQVSDYFDKVKQKYGFSVADNKRLGQILYKMASINKGLGIRTQSLLLTLSNLSHETDSFNTTYNDRLSTLGLQMPIDQTAFITEEVFTEKLNRWVKHIK